MKGRTPTADEKRHMDRIAQLPCIVCYLQGLGASPSEIHHLSGKTAEGAHFKIIPLCFLHHRSGENTLWVSRHPYKSQFERRYGTEQYLLEETKLLLEASA